MVCVPGGGVCGHQAPKENQDYLSICQLSCVARFWLVSGLHSAIGIQLIADIDLSSHSTKKDSPPPPLQGLLAWLLTMSGCILHIDALPCRVHRCQVMMLVEESKYGPRFIFLLPACPAAMEPPEWSSGFKQESIKDNDGDPSPFSNPFRDTKLAKWSFVTLAYLVYVESTMSQDL